tara:strand:+ start:1802 stop:2035 length:234 start_codon:yes stop_codon:yes gene_type:complete
MSDYKNPDLSRKGKFRLDLFRLESQPYQEGDEILGEKKTKAFFDPNLSYNKIYKKGVEIDMGISKKGYAGFRIKKKF